ncbi:MAG TPA: hypothetical protein VMD30_11065 [Tepidisphaeraceae bacterium]|nr:hypothetical protein [Tepidisphaeraceae bacterium]
MTIRPLLILAALLAANPACNSPAFNYPPEASDILANVTRVEAYRVGSLNDHPGFGGKVDGFAALETAHITPGIAHRAAVIALDPASFCPLTQAGDFKPTIAWRFYRLLPDGQGQDAVDMLVDFNSNEVMVVSRDGHLHEYFRTMAGCRPSRQRLIKLARDTFPNDDDLANLATSGPATTQSSQ